MSNIYIYIDTENLPAKEWFPMMCYNHSGLTAILPYTKNSSTLHLEYIAQYGFPKCKHRLLDVSTGTKNALDFVLVAELARQLSSAPKSLHIVVSKDMGYKPAVEFLKNNLIGNGQLVQISTYEEFLKVVVNFIDKN